VSIWRGFPSSELQQRNMTKGGDAQGNSTKNVCTSYLTQIAKPSKVGKPSLNRGPSQHVRDSSNGVILERHSHLHVTWSIGTSRTSRSSKNSCFPYVFHRLVVSCKFRSICFTKFVRQIWTSSLHDIFI
jgi:hypothetical protein